MDGEIGTEAGQFLSWEYINWKFLAACFLMFDHRLRLLRYFIWSNCVNISYYALCVAAASWKGGGFWFCNTGFNIGKFSLGSSARWRKNWSWRGRSASRRRGRTCEEKNTGTTKVLHWASYRTHCRPPSWSCRFWRLPNTGLIWTVHQTMKGCWLYFNLVLFFFWFRFLS